MSETIEERATRITKSIRKYLDEWADDGVMDYYPVESLELIKDLMAERGKKEEALTALEEELQRARDALRWKPIDENTPYDMILLFMSHDGNVRQDFIYDEGLERAQKQYVGWMEIPAYTPEEK